MNVNGVTTPIMVYFPAQAIVPSVPCTEPIGMPMPDPKTAVASKGTSFVKPQVPPKGPELSPEKHTLITRSAFVEPASGQGSAAATVPALRPAQEQARGSLRSGGFDKYA